nr:hypothetical protein [Stenotrophomonas maltophilia]
MKMISRSVLAVAASLALVGAAHAADIVGAASARTDAELYVAVGESQVNGGPHRAGRPASVSVPCPRPSRWTSRA